MMVRPGLLAAVAGGYPQKFGSTNKLMDITIIVNDLYIGISKDGIKIIFRTENFINT